MNKKIVAGLFLIASSVAVSAQQWPAINSVTKPWTRWWWPGSAVNAKDITGNLEAYKAAGLGGVEITPIYGVAGYEKQFIDYLSPQWMRMLDHTLREGMRLQLGVDMATGTGWPFGGGPQIGAGDACRDFNIKTWTLKAGERLQSPVLFYQEPFVRAVGNQIYELHGIYKTEETKGTISEPLLKEASRPPDISKLVEPIYDNKNLQALALDQVQFRKLLPLQVLMAYSNKGQAIDLTSQVDAVGDLAWTAPEGEWTLIAVFMGWHGKMVERAAPGGEGNVIDHFSAAPLKKYLGIFDKAFTGHSLAGLRSFFNDSYEVDDARGESNWTPALLEEFKTRRGYDLRQHLPALLKKERDEYSLRVLHDFRLTLSDLLLEKFTIPWQKWAASKSKMVRNQSHGSPANILDLYGAVDIPETEGVEILRFKFAASAANVLGKPLVAAEAATWLNEHFKSGLRDVKASVDKYFLGGVNHIVYHGTSYSPAGDPWPGWLFYAAVHFQPVHPFWKDFSALNNYVARCQSFLQSGKPDNDVLLYFPFSDKISSPGGREFLHHFDGMNGFDSTDFNTVAEELLHKGVSFDLISDKQLQKVVNSGSLLKAPGGMYKTIILANTKYLPLETLEKLNTLVKNGASVIIYKNYPAGPPGNYDLDKKQDWFTAIATTLKRSVAMGDEIMPMIARANIPVETMTEKGLQFIRRKTATGKYYFILNSSKEAVNDWVPLASKVAAAYIFDPMNKRAGLAKTKVTDGKTFVYLQLQPGESCMLQTSATVLKGTPYNYIGDKGNATEISGEWKVQFISGGPRLPGTTDVNNLRSWTDFPVDGVKEFSGTARYTINFPAPATEVKPDAYLLDLGKVEQTAVVKLNGEKLATLVGPTYQLMIPAVRIRSSNLLEVEVSNSMTNRVIYLEKQGAPYKKFYNVNFPARLAANRGLNGLFTAINWQPEASGLTSTVTLTPVRYMK
jgi:hypothetical protein